MFTSNNTTFLPDMGQVMPISWETKNKMLIVFKKSNNNIKVLFRSKKNTYFSQDSKFSSKNLQNHQKINIFQWIFNFFFINNSFSIINMRIFSWSRFERSTYLPSTNSCLYPVYLYTLIYLYKIFCINFFITNCKQSNSPAGYLHTQTLKPFVWVFLLILPFLP